MVITKNGYVSPEIDLMYFSDDVLLESGSTLDDFDNIGRITCDWLEGE